MGIICSNHKPAKPNNEDFTVPLSDGRKVHNKYYFVTKFINPQTYKNREIDIDQCSIEQNLQKIIPSIRSGDDVFVIQFQPSQVISLDIMKQEISSSIKTYDKGKLQQTQNRGAANILESFRIITINK